MTVKHVIPLLIYPLFALLPLFTSLTWAQTATTCPAVEDPAALGGVTRAERFDQTVRIDLPLTENYCSDPDKPTLDEIENDLCAGKTLDQNKAECQLDQNTRSPSCSCVYWLESGLNCPTNQDGTPENNLARDQMKREIVTKVKAKLSERQISSPQNTNTTLKTEADTIHEGTQIKLRTPGQAADPAFVNSTVGETAKAKGEDKVYYAACFNLDFSELGLPQPETGWFTMVKSAPPLSGIVPPSFKKENALMAALQNGVSQLPGEDPVIKALTDQEPNFSNDAVKQKDFPKIELKLAAKKVDGSNNKYLVYWKFCTARGVDSCDISNFIADLEDTKTKQTVVATTPTEDFGKNTSDPATGDYQCFTTGDLNTGPLTVSSDVYGGYFSLRAKIVGQASDELPTVTTPHCQNSAEVISTVALNNSSTDISFGYGNFANVAYCPENGDYEKPRGDTNSIKVSLGSLAGIVRLETISRLFNTAKDLIFNVFEKHVKVESPPAMRNTCEATKALLCGENKVTSQGGKLAVSQTATPSQITPTAGPTPISVEIKVVNNSDEDATDVDIISFWPRGGGNISNIVRDDGLEFSGNQVSWHLDQIPGNNTSDNTTILRYTAIVTPTAQEVYRAQTLVYGDVTSNKDVVASHSDVPFVVGTATPSTPTVTDASGLKVRQTLTPVSAPVGTGMQLVNVAVWVSNDSGKTISNAILRSTFDHTDKVIVNSDGGLGSEIITGGMQWTLADLLPNAEDTLTYSAYVDLNQNLLFKTKAELTGTMLTTTREAASYENAAITIGQSTSLCEKIAWIVCYFTEVQDRLKNKTYTKDVVIHTYPYPNVAYTQALQTDAINGRDGYYNFAVPPQDEYGSKPAQQELTNKISSGVDQLTKTIVMGANEIKLNQTKIMQDYFTPPGQTPPPDIATDINDDIGGSSCPTPPNIPIPPTATNQAFTIAACNNLSIPARSSYTEDILERAATAEGVPVNLLAAVLFAEHRGAYTATGPDPTCVQSACAAFGWFQITCGWENVVCAEQNPTRHCSDNYCYDANGNGVVDTVRDEFKNWFNCPTGSTTADVCDPAQAAVLAAQKLKGKIGVDRNHVWTANDVCRASAKYFGAVGNCDTAGGTYPSLGNCTYGHYAREFVNQAGL